MTDETNNKTDDPLIIPTKKDSKDKKESMLTLLIAFGVPIGLLIPLLSMSREGFRDSWIWWLQLANGVLWFLVFILRFVLFVIQRKKS